MRALINDTGITHGKLSFVVSQLAVHRVVDHHIKNTFDSKDFTDTYWAGDGVLEKN